MASTSEDREENLDGNENIEKDLDEHENADEGFNDGNQEEITPRVNFIKFIWPIQIHFSFWFILLSKRFCLWI